MNAHEAIELAKQQILADIASGVVPATVSTFSELHDYVDANGYGNAFQTYEQAGESEREEVSVLFSHVQNELDKWLRAGREVQA